MISIRKQSLSSYSNISYDSDDHYEPEYDRKRRLQPRTSLESSLLPPTYPIDHFQKQQQSHRLEPSKQMYPVLKKFISMSTSDEETTTTAPASLADIEGSFSPQLTYSTPHSSQLLHLRQNPQSPIRQATTVPMHKSLQLNHQPQSESSTKYKTELCNTFNITGQCDYGSKCRFAHGKEDLQNKPQNNNAMFRTKPCKSFHERGFCPYGPRCNFMHESRTLPQIQCQRIYQKKITFCGQFLKNTPSSNVIVSRLPIFNYICSSDKPFANSTKKQLKCQHTTD